MQAWVLGAHDKSKLSRRHLVWSYTIRRLKRNGMSRGSGSTIGVIVQTDFFTLRLSLAGIPVVGRQNRFRAVAANPRAEIANDRFGKH